MSDIPNLMPNIPKQCIFCGQKIQENDKCPNCRSAEAQRFCTSNARKPPHPWQLTSPKPMLSKGAYSSCVRNILEAWLWCWVIALICPQALAQRRLDPETVLCLTLFFSSSLFLSIIILIISIYKLIYRSWRLIQNGYARTTPKAAVGLSLIPLFNIYWIFVAIHGLAKDMNAYAKRYKLNVPRIPAELVFRIMFFLLSGGAVLGIVSIMGKFSTDTLLLCMVIALHVGVLLMLFVFYKIGRTAEAIQKELLRLTGQPVHTAGKREKWVIRSVGIITILLIWAYMLFGLYWAPFERELEEQGFKFTRAIISVTITDYIGSDTNVTIPDGVTSIGNYAFSYCKSLTSVTIPESVKSIGKSAFRNCDNLTAVTIPESVKSIGDSAFYYCDSLTSVTIPNSVTSIGEEAFSHCDSLTSVTIPDSVTSIGENAFIDYPKLTIYGTEGSAAQTYAEGHNIPFSTGPLPYCDAAGFYYSHDGKTLLGAPRSLSGEYTIPNSVTSIGNGAFYECKSLTSVTIPNSVTSIGNSAFRGCKSLTSVTIPDSVTSIGKVAFAGCSSLTSVTIPDSVTSIGNYAFSRCERLTSVTIPDSVTSIGDYAFYECSSLTSVTIPNSVTSIGDSAFYECSSLTSVTIPHSVTSIG